MVVRQRLAATTMTEPRHLADVAAEDAPDQVYVVPDGYTLGARNFRGNCRSCHAEILWATHDVTGRRHPFDLDGTSHFATCPQASSWRKPK